MPAGNAGDVEEVFPGTDNVFGKKGTVDVPVATFSASTFSSLPMSLESARVSMTVSPISYFDPRPDMLSLFSGRGGNS